MSNNNLFSALTVFGMSLTIVCGLHAQSDSARTASMMPEVVISANKIEVVASLVPQQIKSISASEIAWQNAPNAADLLQNTGAAYIQKSPTLNLQGHTTLNLQGQKKTLQVAAPLLDLLNLEDFASHRTAPQWVVM